MNGPVDPASLRAMSLLTPLTDEEAAKLACAAVREDYVRGTVIFREGESVRRIWIVESGTVAIELVSQRQLRRLHTVGPGELLGWSPVLGSGVMTATGRALEDVRTLAFDAAAVSALCEADAAFGYRFMRNVARAIAARLNSTRLHLLDIFKADLPQIAEGAEL